jgi:hypothetical protein
MILQDGKLTSLGNPRQIVAEYAHEPLLRQPACEWINPAPANNGQEVHLERITVRGGDGNARNLFRASEDIYIDFGVAIRTRHDLLKIGYQLVRQGVVAFVSEHVDNPGGMPMLPEGRLRLTCKIAGALLNAGEYQIVPLVSLHCLRNIGEWPDPVLAFRVEVEAAANKFHTVLNENNHPGALFPHLKWVVHRLDQRPMELETSTSQPIS